MSGTRPLCDVNHESCLPKAVIPRDMTLVPAETGRVGSHSGVVLAAPRVIRSKVDRVETRMEAPMSELKTSTEEILVHLVRPGVGERDYHLSAGATLADLLRLSETSTTNQAVFID